VCAGLFIAPLLDHTPSRETSSPYVCMSSAFPLSFPHQVLLDASLPWINEQKIMSRAEDDPVYNSTSLRCSLFPIKAITSIIMAYPLLTDPPLSTGNQSLSFAFCIQILYPDIHY